jgi:hypothetical protein
MSLIFFINLFINLSISPNLFGWVPYLSKSLQDFSRDFSELRTIFHGQKDNSIFFGIIFIRGIKIIPKFRNSEKFPNPTTIYIWRRSPWRPDFRSTPLSRAAAHSSLHLSPKFCIYSLRSGELSDELFRPNRRFPTLATTTKR